MLCNQVPSQIRTPGIEDVIREAVKAEQQRKLTIIEHEHDIYIMFGGSPEERTLTFGDLLALQVALSRELGPIHDFTVSAGNCTLCVSGEF